MYLIIKNKLTNKFYINEYNKSKSITDYILCTSRELQKDIDKCGIDCFMINVVNKKPDRESDYKLDEIKPRYYGYANNKYYSVTSPDKIPGKVYTDREELLKDIAQM